MSSPSVANMIHNAVAEDQVEKLVSDYVRIHDETRGGDVESRKANYGKMVNDYYDLATDFYEYGWGQSFHFAPRFAGESLQASIVRHEYYLALKLGLRPGMQVVDVGCGVGGPMRNIARFSAAAVTGINNNAYQIKRGTDQVKRAGLSTLCSFKKADFLHMPFDEGHFDAGYAIEATCHAPDKKAIYGEIFRVLKEGACFAAYEWCLTSRYQADNPEHGAIKKGIEEGNALPDISTTAEVLASLRAVGFEILESADLAETSDRETPWYLPLSGPWYTPSGFRSTKPGRFLTHQMVRTMEFCRIAPKGATEVSSFLERGARALVRGGEIGVFTPMFYFLVRKPERTPRQTSRTKAST